IAAVLACAVLLVTGAPLAASADVNDFSFASWDVTYQLEQQESGRVHANVTEEIVPVFPEYDQNRGIIRSLPRENFGAPSAPHHISITDETGAYVPFTTEEDDELLYILVGDNDFVHGKQTYVLNYTVNDVIAP